MKALVVEPSKVYRQMYQAMLETHQIEVIFTSTGSEALQQLEKNRFDIIYAALHLNDMKGTAFCEAFHERFEQYQTPIIMVTSDNDPAITAEALASGATEIFHKNNFADISNYLATFVDRVAQQNKLCGNILYMEDSAAIAQHMIYTLEEMGFTISHHTTAEEGLSALAEGRFDLVLTYWKEK